MPRLFVAVRPPEHVRTMLLALMGGIAGARWQDDSQLHLTLRFIGEVDRHQAEDVDAALAAVRHPGFDLAVDGLGTFSRRGDPGVLWAGVKPQEPLKTLHKKVDQALLRAGLEPERRAYAPHITLARLSRGAGSVKPLLEAAGGVSSAAFPVPEFRLYESRLTSERAFHALVRSYPLS